MDFKSDLRRIIQEEFSVLGISYTQNDLRELCIHYMNTKFKLIQPGKRVVTVSNEYSAKVTGQPFEPILDDIKSKFIHGVDINPHLSKQILKPDFDDYLLSDWSIHHIHISNSRTNPSDYFYDRSDKLLFALVRDGIVYFVDVRPHNETNVFSNREILEIVDRNWPEITNQFVLDGVIGVTHNCNNEEIAIARKKGLNVCLEINGKVIAPMGLGLMTSGDAFKSVNATHNLLDAIDNRERELAQNSAKIKEQIENKLKKKLGKVDFRLEINGPHLIIRETESGLIL